MSNKHPVPGDARRHIEAGADVLHHDGFLRHHPGRGLDPLRCITGLDCPWLRRGALEDHQPLVDAVGARGAAPWRARRRASAAPTLPPASMLGFAASSESSKRTEICRRRGGRSIASSARLISARFAGLVRTMSLSGLPVSAPPGSTTAAIRSTCRPSGAAAE